MLDIIILLVLIGGIVRGFMVGAVRQVTSILGVVAAFVMAVQLMRPAGATVVDSLGLSEALAPVLGFLVVFIAVQLVFYLLGRLVEKLLDALALNTVNRLFGSALGGFKAALLLSIAFLILTQLNMPDPRMKARSVLYRPIAQVLPETWAAVSEYVPNLKTLSEQFGGRIEDELVRRRDEATLK